jgi:hypothetical protein
LLWRLVRLPRRVEPDRIDAEVVSRRRQGTDKLKIIAAAMFI